LSTSRQEEIIRKGFIKSLIEGTLELKDLAGINIDLDIARQAYIQGVQETTQALIELVKTNMATAAGQALQATGAKQDTMKTVLDAVQVGTDKIIADAATATKQDLQATAAGQALQATGAKQDLLKGVMDDVKTGTDKIIADAATAAKQDLQATAAGQALQATGAKQDLLKGVMDDMKAVTDNIQTGTDKIIVSAATEAKQDELLSYYDYTWQIEALEYINESGAWGTQADDPYDIYISPNGLNVYYAGMDDGEINQLYMPVPYSVLNLTVVRSLNVAAKEATPTGVTFKYDGTKMYIIGVTNTTVHEYDLGTPWDISTAVWLQAGIDLGAHDTATYSMHMNDAGTRLYILGDQNHIILECVFGTPWDSNTLSVFSTYGISTLMTTTRGGIFVKEDGTMLWIAGQNKVYALKMSIPWNTAYLEVVSGIDITTYGSGVTGIFWKPDGSRLLVGTNGVPEVLCQYEV